MLFVNVKFFAKKGPLAEKQPNAFTVNRRQQSACGEEKKGNNEV